MPINALRKAGARMSLQEALDRVDKLKRLSQSSNEHEAALAALRLKTFDIDAARAPRTVEEVPDVSQSVVTEEMVPVEKAIEVLDAFPEIPYETMDDLEAHQPPDKSQVNWDELHFALLQMARKAGADAVLNLQLKGTVSKKCLAGTAIRYLTAKDLYEIDQENSIENEEEAIDMEAKERRDENTAPDYG
ncbi:MAG: hypothetical protein VST68_00345 [Nitrospirota bacterium]|nr:hypothetical protein [Nitrospirota bacterium]